MADDLSNGKPGRPAKASPSRATLRVRRCRARRRRGFRCLTIEISDRDIDGLIRLKRLNPDYRNDLAAVRMVLYKFLNEALF
jgi:hypothetical protein